MPHHPRLLQEDLPYVKSKTSQCAAELPSWVLRDLLDPGQWKDRSQAIDLLLLNSAYLKLLLR